MSAPVDPPVRSELASLLDELKQDIKQEMAIQNEKMRAQLAAAQTSQLTGMRNMKDSKKLAVLRKISDPSSQPAGKNIQTRLLGFLDLWDEHIAAVDRNGKEGYDAADEAFTAGVRKLFEDKTEADEIIAMLRVSRPPSKTASALEADKNANSKRARGSDSPLQCANCGRFGHAVATCWSARRGSGGYGAGMASGSPGFGGGFQQPFASPPVSIYPPAWPMGGMQPMQGPVAPMPYAARTPCAHCGGVDHREPRCPRNPANAGRAFGAQVHNKDARNDRKPLRIHAHTQKPPEPPKTHTDGSTQKHHAAPMALQSGHAPEAHKSECLPAQHAYETSESNVPKSDGCLAEDGSDRNVGVVSGVVRDVCTYSSEDREQECRARAFLARALETQGSQRPADCVGPK